GGRSSSGYASIAGRVIDDSPLDSTPSDSQSDRTASPLKRLTRVELVPRFEPNLPGLAAIKLGEASHFLKSSRCLLGSRPRLDVDGKHRFIECRRRRPAVLLVPPMWVEDRSIHILGVGQERPGLRAARHSPAGLCLAIGKTIASPPGAIGLRPVGR